MLYCINIKQSKAKRELYLLINNSLKTFLILLLTFILSFSISCSNEDKTGSEENNSGNGSSGSAVNNHLSGSSTGAGTAADLEGRWGVADWQYIGITNGQLTTPITPPYKGQIPSSFNYPFSIVLTSAYGGETGTAVFTFFTSTNGAYYYYKASTGSGGKIDWALRVGASGKN